MNLNITAEEINLFASLFNFNTIDFNLLYNISNDSYSHYLLDNSLCVFKSKNDLIYHIYSNFFNSIIFFNIIDNKKLNEIKNAHNFYISSFTHHFDIYNKRDLIISISARDNNIKLWDINNLECILNLKNINENGFLFSSCFLNDNNQNYIITSNYKNNKYYGNPELIKIFDFNGKKIKEINNSCDDTFFIDNYYDNKINRNYIITGNINNVKSYDYKKNEIYQIYSDNDNDNNHRSIIIINNEELIKLIESSGTGNINIWNFHSGDLLNRIKVINENELYGICLWNNNYLLVGCNDNTIKIIELNNGTIIKEIYGHNNKVITIKNINHPSYGMCIISKGYQKDKLKLWEFRN